MTVSIIYVLPAEYEVSDENLNPSSLAYSVKLLNFDFEIVRTPPTSSSLFSPCCEES